ncbi:serine/threonine protein kinase [Saccharothrix tamanrassetensis]|uniref:Serine/threonine protein kinase n=1 Tax=Saccharothrix tamanrassetensis TaxID=1051531 RepID=A0A841CP16_9PSEU|nr:serine/threonine-protein kinase [Saccharothrix tamanrassetensis]MBB5959401.1 serine/threonine protein kinase [Saccharothrix tamanrassetensis]
MQPLPPNAPPRIGDYTLLAALGRGAMGSVYLARSRGGRPVAVKVARAELADNPEFRERFRREVEMARSVGGFWTATVVGADPDADRPWMATEYVPGPTLHQAVQDYGPLPERAVRRLAGGLAEALVAIHGAGLVHRDLKPSNVLLANDGPRVIDFGIARAMEHSALTEAGIVFGTPGYLSPEQVVGSKISPQSDVFALGSVLVYAATGAGPFGEGATSALVYRVVHQEPDLSRVPPGLVPLIVPCLVREPLHRPSPARLLELIGPPSSEPSWLPAQIRTLVEQRHTELRELPAKPPTRVLAEERKPPTRLLVEDPPPAAAPAVPKVVPPSGPIRPYTPPSKKSGVQFKTSRAVGLGWTAAHALAAVVCGSIADSASGAQSGVRLAAFLAFGVFALVAIRLLVGTVRTPLTIDVGPDGITVSSGEQKRRLPWYAISRVKVEGPNSRPWVVVWLVGAAQVPETLGRGSFQSYKGGLRVYPISHERYRKRRERDVAELRSALAWYGPTVYDAR